MKNGILLHTQLVLFFDPHIRRPDRLSYTLIDKIEYLSEIIPNITYFQNPIIGTNSHILINLQGDNFNVSINQERLDLYINKNIDTDNEVENTFISLAKKILDGLESISISRIGIISLVFYETDNADEYIKCTYLKDTFKHGKELQVKMNILDKFKNKDINNVINIYSGNIKKGKNTILGLFYNKDVNTVPSTKELSKEYIKDFFSKQVNKFQLDF